MTDAVLGNTYDLPASDFAAIRRSTADRALAARDGDPNVPSTAYFDDPHKFSVDAMTPPVSLAVGSARTARVQYWPALKDLSMYSLRIREDGMREPHWHPITAEMGYVNRGGARMTVMDPDGTLDTWYLQQGDVYFIPAPTRTTSRSSTPRDALLHLLRPADPGRHRVPHLGERVLAPGARRDLRHPRRRPAPIPVHEGRPADRQAPQPR